MNGVTTRPRKATRIMALAGACGLAILSLSGCIKVNSDVAISSDATGTGSLSLELQKQAASLMMMGDLAAFESGMTSGDLAGQGLGTFGTCAASETSDAFVYTCTFTDETFTAADGPWIIAKDGNEIIFTMVNSGADTGGATAGSDAAALLGGASVGEINVKVTFPGPITGMRGAQATKTSDTEVSIKASLTDNLDVRITSAASGSSKIAALLVVAGAGLVLLLIIIVAVVMIMRRKKAAAAAAPMEQAAMAEDMEPTQEVEDMAPTQGAVIGEAVVAEPVVLADAGAPMEETAVLEEVATVEEPPAAVDPVGPEDVPKPE